MGSTSSRRVGLGCSRKLPEREAESKPVGINPPWFLLQAPDLLEFLAWLFIDNDLELESALPSPSCFVNVLSQLQAGNQDVALTCKASPARWLSGSRSVCLRVSVCFTCLLFMKVSVMMLESI